MWWRDIFFLILPHFTHAALISSGLQRNGPFSGLPYIRSHSLICARYCSNSAKRDYSFITKLLIANLHDAYLFIHPNLLHLHRWDALQLCHAEDDTYLAFAHRTSTESRIYVSSFFLIQSELRLDRFRFLLCVPVR